MAQWGMAGKVLGMVLPLNNSFSSELGVMLSHDAGHVENCQEAVWGLSRHEG